MARIVLIVESKENRHLLNAFLSAYHSVGEHEPGQSLEEAFDLCIVDGPSLNRFKNELEKRRDQEQPGILPVLLVVVLLQHEHESCRAQKGGRDQQRHGRRCRERGQPQRGTGRFLDIIDQSLKHG